MYSLEEKILLLGALFHDIGKFEQRCRNYKGKSHSSLGAEFVETLKPEFIKIFENDSSAFSRFKDIILHHHNRDNADFLVTLCTLSDHISASERVILEQKEEPSETWQHKFLSSIFSKINLLKDFKVNNKYYQHRTLDKSDYNILLPKFESTSDAAFSNAHYKSGTWEDFEKDTQTVLGFYDNNDDFNSVVNLLLMVFEKYMWCIPDFTGSQHTDISLYNHLKDVTALSHALYISKRDSKKPDTTKLNLIIGDLPGIQSYIFNVINKKLAKILRGRSIFVQVITSVFANIFLDSFGLTESNLIMLAGGKFYIIAPDSQSFIEKYSAAVHKIEKILVKNYDYEFKFAAGCYTFDAIHLRDKKDSSIPSAQRKKMDSFGDIIEKASFNLLKGRNQIFKKHLFAKLDEKNFILDKVYKKESDSDKVKCAVTAIPLTENNKRVIKMYEKDDEIEVSKQVKIEFEIGSQITHQTVVIPILISPDGYFNILEPKGLSKFKTGEENYRILINPKLEELLSVPHKSQLLHNTRFIEVANYASLAEDGNVLEFDKMEKCCEGAQYLTLIKADIDNLGLIMAYGLVADEFDYTSISRTTTLSNQLKYFFSFFLNGFLRKDWDYSADCKKSKDQLVYTIFAGGDDLMLVTPQSSSLKLIHEINNKFSEFTCNNEEIHISFSLTNFKHNTPIKIVSEFADTNQTESKRRFENNKSKSIDEIILDNNFFLSSFNKSGTFLFDSVIKNGQPVNDLLVQKKQLVKWIDDKNSRVSKGVIRNLMALNKLLLVFERNGCTDNLLYHPKLNYMINRLFKDKSGNYASLEIKDFFESALKLNKEDLKAERLKEILFPLLNEVIYATRNSKGE